MDEQQQDTPEQRPADRGDGRPQVVRIRTDQSTGADGPPVEGRHTRRLGRLESHAKGPIEATGPDRRRATSRATGRLLPFLLLLVGLAAVAWGALVLAGVL